MIGTLLLNLAGVLSHTGPGSAIACTVGNLASPENAMVNAESDLTIVIDRRGGKASMELGGIQFSLAEPLLHQSPSALAGRLQTAKNGSHESSAGLLEWLVLAQRLMVALVAVATAMTRLV